MSLINSVISFFNLDNNLIISFLKMNHKFFAALVALSSSASAHLLPRNEGVARCAVPEPSAQQLGNARALQELETASLEADLEAFSAPIFIDVYVHVVSSAESKYISVSNPT
jgi:hypothetical protein